MCYIVAGGSAGCYKIERLAVNYFYILKSSKDEKLYYGSTTDLKKRMSEHSKGKVESTKNRRPFTLVYYEAYLDIGSARKREQQIKSSGNARKTIYDRINTMGL